MQGWGRAFLAERTVRVCMKAPRSGERGPFGTEGSRAVGAAEGKCTPHPRPL